MLNKKEILIISVIILIITISLSLLKDFNFFLQTLLAVFLVIAINISAKKIAGFYLESEVEIKLWEIKRYGIKTFRSLKKPFPAGAIFPIISKIILFPIQNLVWMASLVFDAKPKIHRAAKKHGFRSFTKITEEHLGIIAAMGIIANLLISLIAYSLNFPIFAKLSIYYAFFNMIPLSKLDGNKIFFGNLLLWGFLASITLLGLFFAVC